MLWWCWIVDSVVDADEVDSMTVSDQPFVEEVLSKFGKLLPLAKF